MLMNNLDPEVAERPARSRRLRRHRQGGAHLGGLRRHRARARSGSATTRRCSCSRARRSASSARTRTRRACSSPTPTSCRTGRPGRSSGELEAAGPDDVRPDDRRARGSTSARRASCRARTRRSPPAARTHFGGGRTSRARCVLTAGLGGMGGAQPLAVTMTGGVFLGVEVDPTRIQRRLETRYLDEAARDLDEALAPRRRARSKKGARSRSALVRQRRRRLARARAPRRRARPRHRSDLGARSAATATCPQRPRRSAQAAELRAARSRRSTSRRARASMADARARHARAASSAAPHVFDYGNNLRGQARARAASSDAFDVSRASCPRTSARCSARARGRSAGSRSRAIPTTSAVTDEAVLELFPDDAHLHRWIDAGARARRSSRGCRRASAGSATASAHRVGLRVQRAGAHAARSRRRSSSAAITSTAARSPRPTARPRR